MHRPEESFPNDKEDEQIPDIAEFFRTWAESDIVGWPDASPKLSKPVEEGGCWTGSKISLLSSNTDVTINSASVQTKTADAFPFVGPLPGRDAQFIAAGFAGHGTSSLPWSISELTHTGMPRILLSAAHITPLILSSLGLEHTTPALARAYPPLPQPFHATASRISKLQNTDVAAIISEYNASCANSAKKPFCNIERTQPQGTAMAPPQVTAP